MDMKLNRYFYKAGIQTAKKQCKSNQNPPGQWWLTPVILATPGDKDQEDHSSKPAPAKVVLDTLSGKRDHKKGLAEWNKQ
jgi:hypothetical protein